MPNTPPARCQSETYDRATREMTRCVLPEDHVGRHDDGALVWCEEGDCRCGKTPEKLAHRPFAGRFLV